MAVVSTEVVEEHWNLVVCSHLDIAHVVGSSSIFAGYVVVVSHLVHEIAEYVSLEGIMADGAFSCSIEVFDIRKRHDEAFDIEEVCLALVLYPNEFGEKPLNRISSCVNTCSIIVELWDIRADKSETRSTRLMLLI